MRILFIFIALAALEAPVSAQSALQLYGKTGYLGEYELSGTVSEQIPYGRREFSGPLVIKHVGLCIHNGPQETTSPIKLQIEGSSQRVTATLVFEGAQCTYRGVLTESYHGFMDCADQTSLHSDCGPNERFVREIRISAHTVNTPHRPTVSSIN